MLLLELDGIKKIYRQGAREVHALRGVDLKVEKREFTTIFGPSGSGKTTLLNMVGCLDTPTEGKLIFEGRELDLLKGKDLAAIRRKNIGFIFQSYNLIPVLTAYENVEFALRLAEEGKKDSELSERVMEILTAVGLEGLENRKPDQLSGGQNQRVAIARALVKKPGIVLADEPTANLDSKTGEEVLEVMLSMNEKLDTTFIFSTHDPAIMEYAKRRIEIKDGLISGDIRL